MKKNIIISFSGADGVGKSTQIKLVGDYFDKKGITYRIFYARTRNAKPCQLLMERINKNPTKWNRTLYMIVNYILCVHFFGTLKSLKRNNQILLMDRTLVDSMVDQMMVLKYKRKIYGIWMDRKKKLEIKIYFDANIETIRKRMEKRGEIFDYEQTKRQLNLYKKMLKLHADQYVCIDANRDEFSIFKDVIKIFHNEMIMQMS